MSSFKKNTLAAALVLGMTVAGSAAAYTVYTNPLVGARTSAPAAGLEADAEDIALQSGSTFSMTQPVVIDIDLGDAVVGRTTGLQVKVTLVGAQFDGTGANPAPPLFTVGPATGATGDWNAVYAAGGSEGTTILQYRLEPNTISASITTGQLGGFSPFNLQNAPGDVFAVVDLIDPVTGTGLHSQRIQLVDRVDGIDFECVANANPDKIDVGVGSYPSKTSFVSGPSWTIGYGDHLTANLGTIGLDITGYTPTTTDQFLSTVTGDFNGFTDVFLATDGTCTTAIASYTIDTAETTAELDVPYSSLAPYFGPTGGAANLCVTVDGTTQIAAQQFTVQNGLNALDDAEEACVVAPIDYNGSVVRVYNVNPAGVSSAESFVRVINPSNTTGRVSIVGWDDNGDMRGPLTFNLTALNSRQFNSQDIEAGNAAKLAGAFGDGVGKWRLEITGEFPGMRVQSLNRNYTDGTVTNLTDADGHGEQAWEKLFD